MEERTPLEHVLACRSLPTLPSIAVQLLELTRKPDVALADIAKLVKNDIGLSARVLKTVNSSIFALKQACNSIERALALLGLNTVKSLVLGFSLVDCTKGVNDGEGFDLSAYWRRCIYAAAGARSVAEATRAADPDDAFIAALFQDMGVMAGFVGLGVDYVMVLQSVTGHDQLADAERQVLQFTHMQVGAELARRWKLQDKIVDAIEFHHDPDAAPAAHQGLCRCVALGRIAADAILAESPGPYVAQLYSKAKSWFDRRREDVAAVMGRISVAADELGKLFEKPLGPRPDLETLLASASEQLLEHQMASQQEAEALRLKTITDALTGANNRTCFNEQLPKLWEECKAGAAPMAALFCDADKFKSVNDTHGHAAGDAVLVELSRRLRASVGEAGQVFRYGGEEFAVLLPRVGHARAADIAEAMRAAIAASPFDLSLVQGAPPTLPVTISVGVAATDLPSAPSAPDQLVHMADEGVYAAKRAGRNRVCVHGVEATPAVQPALAPSAPPSPAGAVAAPAPVPAPSSAAPPAPATPSSAKIPTPGPTPVHVLLIEDDALAAALLAASFKKGGLAALAWVRTRGQALAQIAKAASGAVPSPTLIILDVQLPDANGIDLLGELRRAGATATAFVISANADPKTRERALAAGAVQFTSKHELAQQMSAWIAGAIATASSGATIAKAA